MFRCITHGLVLLIVVPGCLMDTGRGPDLGDCANYPDKIYTYGEVGIGTCLAGPTDLEFFEQDGRTWLAVSNADPFRNFEHGSLLLLDFASVDETRPFNTIDNLIAYSLPLESFVGGLAYAPDIEVMTVTGRLTEESVNRFGNDEVFAIDVSDPTAPVLRDEYLEVREDPYPSVYDPTTGLIYVGNITDHSISVIDATTTPLEVIDVAPVASIDEEAIFDFDGSGSTAEIASMTIDNTDLLLTDQWTLDYVDATWRLWVPTESADLDYALQRWSTGGLEVVESGIALELDPANHPGVLEIRDPFAGSVAGVPVIYYEDVGVIRQASAESAAIGSWTLSDAIVQEGVEGQWDAWVGGPSVLGIAELIAVYYDGREEDGLFASIGASFSDDAINFVRQADPLVTAPAGFVSVEDPFVMVDTNTNTVRMWLSMYDGANWVVGHTESSDTGVTWAEPEVVLSVVGGDVAAPAVSVLNGRYVMWAAHGDGVTWTHATAWSYDGLQWFDFTDELASSVAYDPLRPPRIGLDADATGAWRVEGESAGLQASQVASGFTYIQGDLGFSFRLANGFELGAGVSGATSNRGISPGSWVEIDGVPTLFATTWSISERPYVAILQDSGDGTLEAEVEDVFAPGTLGNDAGVESPIVFHDGSQWVMLLGGRDAADVVRIHRATSPDGLVWTMKGLEVVPVSDSWDSVEQQPRSVVETSNGFRLYYGGFDGSRWRIGAATSPNGVTWTPEPSASDPFQFDSGSPGEFDDTGVRDPMVVDVDGVLHMWYSGFDGDLWTIGKATLNGEDWTRAASPVTGRPEALLVGLNLSFAHAGVGSPVAVPLDDGAWGLFYEGTEGDRPRVGYAEGDLTHMFAHQRFPTAGDALGFRVTRGDSVDSVISINQTVDGFPIIVNGVDSVADDDITNLILDPVGGFLFVLSKLNEGVVVLDIRDDSTDAFDDTNYLDIETVLRLRGVTAGVSFRDGLVREVNGGRYLYLTGRDPEGVVIVDLAQIEDNSKKEVVFGPAMGSLPMTDLSRNAGPSTLATIGGASMALKNDLLLVTHFRDNSVSAFDLSMGEWGEEIRYLADLGENPWTIRISPDGTRAVVANYVGNIDENTVNSTLVVIDIDETSETYLEPLTWIGNL